MIRNFSFKKALCLVLAMSMALSCAACGGKEGPSIVEEGPGSVIEAASMWLVKTEGNVAVTDSDGADVSLIDRLGLYSGYGVKTKAASYGWIDLDDVKLTKMDENSDIEVEKDGRHLTLTVNRGAVFFNVTRPLEEDETFEIRASTMVTAIRGTCGWVEVPDDGHMNVYILEGTVECSVGDVAMPVAAGESAAISRSEETIEIGTFTAADAPAFVTSEVENDAALAEEIIDASGLDILNPAPAPDPAVLSGVYFGDPAASTMTADQASQLARVLREVMAEVDREYDQANVRDPEQRNGMGHYARIFDAGDGRPALFYAGGVMYDSGSGPRMAYYFTYRAYHFPGEQVEQFGYDGQIMSVYDGWVLSGGTTPGGTYHGEVHELTGFISPEVSYYAEGDIPNDTYTLDGQNAGWEQFDRWRSTWEPDTELRTFEEGDLDAHYDGFVPAEDVLTALDIWSGEAEP